MSRAGLCVIVFISAVSPPFLCVRACVRMCACVRVYACGIYVCMCVRAYTCVCVCVCARALGVC